MRISKFVFQEQEKISRARFQFLRFGCWLFLARIRFFNFGINVQTINRKLQEPDFKFARGYRNLVAIYLLLFGFEYWISRNPSLCIKILSPLEKRSKNCSTWSVAIFSRLHSIGSVSPSIFRDSLYTTLGRDLRFLPTGAVIARLMVVARSASRWLNRENA